MSAEASRNLCGLGDTLRVFESVLRLVEMRVPPALLTAAKLAATL
jgi:hypothetical protein